MTENAVFIAQAQISQNVKPPIKSGDYHRKDNLSSRNKFAPFGESAYNKRNRAPSVLAESACGIDLVHLSASIITLTKGE